MLLLEQDTTRKEQVDKATSQLKFDDKESGSKKYKVEAICNSAVYTNSWKEDIYQAFTTWFWEKAIQKKKNTWEPVLIMLYFCKLISTFYYDYLEKPTTTSANRPRSTNRKTYNQVYSSGLMHKTKAWLTCQNQWY